LRAPVTKRGRRAGSPRASRRGRAAAGPEIAARLGNRVALEAQTNGTIVARFDGHSMSLGAFSAETAAHVQGLRTGLPLAAFVSDGGVIDEDLHLLVRRLATCGLLEYPLGRLRNGLDRVVIEPQVADFWPKTSPLHHGDALALSRFAYLRRRGNDLVLESPCAQALFRIGDPQVAGVLAALAAPQSVSQLRRQPGFPGLELLALLTSCRILFKVDPARPTGQRSAEGDDNLVLWDFHDLLFHARSTQGRHANPVGGTYPYASSIAPLPAVRPAWPGKKIDLPAFESAGSLAALQGARAEEGRVAKLLRERHSTRDFDDRRAITLVELARFLDATARVQSKWQLGIDFDGSGPMVGYAARSYPSGGAAYELELYLAVDKCEGLPRGFYYYDADAHALTPIAAGAEQLDAMLDGAEIAMGVEAAPQILITIAARFGRVTWKYSSIAYALVLKDVGALMQTLYLMASAMGLGGCAIGTSNIDLFAEMTGLEFHVEGPVGQFALGRGAEAAPSDR
jgi:SagB-type dehydrogenase family enzyme